LFILPEHQGKGIGKACMLQVIHDADAAGLPVRLQVLKVNTRADAFFRKMGFRDAGQTNTHVLMKGL
jgi:ribosomal protein S18 acetylase RimI-like enzyme